MEKVKLKFYKIEQCGYYEKNNKKAKLSNINETLDNLSEWLKGKTLDNTRTTNHLRAKADHLPVFCTGVIKGTDTYIVTTWNQMESTDGKISSIPLAEPLSTISHKVSSAKLPKGNIPGYATYFWFIPEENIMATIRLNHVLTGHIGLDAYIKGFLTRFSKYTVLKNDPKDKTKIKILGYGTSNTKFDNNLYPRFETRPKRLKTEVNYLKKNINKITKVIRKCSINQNLSTDLDLLKSLGYKLGYSKPQEIEEMMELKFELKSKPTIQELNDIMELWDQDKAHDNWDDVGFKLKGCDNPIWLSSEVPTKDLSINILRSNSEFVNVNDLIYKLEKYLPEIKKICKGEG